MTLGDFLERAKFLFDGGCTAQVTSVCVRSMPEQQWVSFTTKIVLAPDPSLKVDVFSGICIAQALKRISSSFEAANALSFIDHGVFPNRSSLGDNIDAKDGSLAASLGQVMPRHVERAPVVRNDDGDFSFEPIERVERHRNLPRPLTAARRRRSPEAGGKCSFG